MSSITTIIFDLDGTLYNSQSLTGEINRTALEFMSNQLDLPLPEAAARLSEAKMSSSARSGFEATLSAACIELGCDLKKMHEFLGSRVIPEPHLVMDLRVNSLLERLQSGFNLYIYTNNNRPLTDRIMTWLDIRRFFSGVFCVEDFWRPKPDRLALAKLYAATGNEPAECLFAGDRHDVDLRLPAEHGSLVLLTRTIDELLTIEELLIKESKT